MSTVSSFSAGPLSPTSSSPYPPIVLTSTPPPPPTPPIRRIAIIGAGPSGLTTLKRLLNFPHFTTIDIFEQRRTIGGIWNYTDQTRHLVPDPVSLSCTESHNGVNGDGEGGHRDGKGWREREVRIPIYDNQSPWALEEARGVGSGGGGDEDHGREKETEVVSPIYPSLTTNLPTGLMAFHDHSFPPGTALFPKHGVVREYLQSYFGSIVKGGKWQGRGEILLGRRVERVERAEGRWRVVIGWSLGANGGGGKETEERWYDAVVMAMGRYTVPYVPDIKGLREWVVKARGKRTVEHARDFREIRERYQGKRVLVVGASLSAIDVVQLVARLGAELPVYQSMRGPPIAPVPEYVQPVPLISRLCPSTGRIYFHPSPPGSSSPSNTATYLDDVDTILFCTGYLLSPTPLYFSSSPPLEIPNSGTHIPSLSLHIFTPNLPTVAFVGLPFKVVPWAVAAGQAAVVGRVWSGMVHPSELPPLPEVPRPPPEVGDDEMVWEEYRAKLVKVHLIGTPQDIYYHDYIASLCAKVDERWRCAHGTCESVAEWENDYPRWTGRMKAMRERLEEVRGRYNELVREGHVVTELEELGLGIE